MDSTGLCGTLRLQPEYCRRRNKNTNSMVPCSLHGSIEPWYQVSRPQNDVGVGSTVAFSSNAGLYSSTTHVRDCAKRETRRGTLYTWTGTSAAVLIAPSKQDPSWDLRNFVISSWDANEQKPMILIRLRAVVRQLQRSVTWSGAHGI